MAKINRKSVGAGKDFSTLKAAMTYFNTRDLVALDEMAFVEVYDNQVINGVNFYPAKSDADHYCIVQPAPGVGFMDLDDPAGPVDYGTLGVKLYGGLNNVIDRGMVLRGFRLEYIGDNSGNFSYFIIGKTNAGRPAEVTQNKILWAPTGSAFGPAITGNGDGAIYDNVLISEGSGPLVKSQWLDTYRRNTFVKRGASTAPNAGQTATYGQGAFDDNVFIGFGGVPLNRAVSGAPAGAPCTNNFTDAAITSGPTSGFTVVTGANALIQDLNDLRPTAAGPLVGTCSASGRNIPDVRNKYRGAASDVGAVQLTPAALPAVPVLTITNKAINAVTRTMTVTGTTTNSPRSGLATLPVAAIPNGAVAPGLISLTFGAGTFSAVWANLTPGDYDVPTVTATNYGGTSAVATGGTVTTITPPPLPQATITSRSVYGNTMILSGTTTNVPTSGTATLPADATPNGAVEQGPIAVTLGSGTFTVTFSNIHSGNYATPAIVFSNSTGSGANADGGTPYVIAAAVIPAAVITEQVRVGQRVYFSGTFSNFPDTATMELAAAVPANGGVAVAPAALALDKTNMTFTGSVNNIVPGDYQPPMLKFTNSAGTGTATAGTAFSILSQAVVPIPGATIKTVGAGKDFATLALAAQWLNTRDLVANGENINIYVYDDFVAPNTAFLPVKTDASHRCYITPAPGLSVVDIEDHNSPYGYGKYGVELTLPYSSGIQLGAGVTMSGFRIHWPTVAVTSGFPPIFISKYGQGTNPDENAFFIRNRVWSELDGAGTGIRGIDSGNSSVVGNIQDNVFFHTAGDAPDVKNGIAAVVLRNTFVHSGTATGKTAFLNDAYGDGQLSDNVFVNCGAAPTSGPAITNTSNNLANTVINPGVNGLAFDTVKQFIVSLTDARPAAGGALIAKGSAESRSINDGRGYNRGTVPDLGACQLAFVVPLPTVTITSQSLNGRKLTLSGIVTDGPTSGLATLPIGDTPEGAVEQGPKAITLPGDSTFSVIFDNIPGGIYKAPVITATNPGGMSAPAGGGTAIEIQTITGNAQAVLPPPVIGIDNANLSAGVVTASGTVNFQGDESGSVVAFFDPVGGGASVGPFTATVSTPTTWNFSHNAPVGANILRMVVTLSDGQTGTVSSSTLANTLNVDGVVKMPLR